MKMKIVISLAIFVMFLEGKQFYSYADIPRCKKNFLQTPDPIYYKNPREIWEKDHKHYGFQCWHVFADKQNICLYKNPDSTSECVHRINFLEHFYVDKREGMYLYVKGKKTKKEGWGKIQEFIILNRAIKTEYNISHKGLPINSIIDNPIIETQEKFENSKQVHYDEIRFLDTPIQQNDKFVYNRNVMKIMRFAYIYQYYPSEDNPTYVLLGKKDVFYPGEENHINKVILGWVKFNRIMRWNTKEALQPNPTRKYPIYFFKRKDYLESYYKHNKSLCDIPSCKNIPKCKKSNKDAKYKVYEILPETCKNLQESKNTEWPLNKFRYTILKTNNEPKIQPFYVGISTITTDKEKVGQFISERNLKSEYLDIVFLFDATKSMAKFIPLLSNIVKEMINTYHKYFGGENKLRDQLRFGVALYRDYYDKRCINNTDKECEYIINQMINNNNVLEEIEMLIEQDRIIDFTFQKICQLTEKIHLLEEKVNHVEPINEELTPEEPPVDPAYFPEAVYQGITNCAKQMKWRDFAGKMIIHIGDAGNHSREFDNITPEKIAELLVEKDISYIPIQLVKAPSSDEREYIKKAFIESQHLFSEQCRSILLFAAQKEKELINNFYKYGGVTMSEPVDLSDLNDILDKENEDISCHSANINSEKICNECGKGRWKFNCINIDKDNKPINPFKNSAITQITNLCEDVKSTKHILDIIDGGILPSTGTIHSPHLMPREIKKIINNIGTFMYKQKDENSDIKKRVIEIIGNDLLTKSQQEHNLFNKIKQFVINTIGKDNFIESISNGNIKKKVIFKIGEQYLKILKTKEDKLYVISILGANEFNNFLKSEAKFYTTAYVKQIINKEIQLYKTIFLSQSDVITLMSCLKSWDKEGRIITEDIIKELWETMLKILLGSGEVRDKSISFIEAYQSQFGITVRSKHKILSYSYSQIINNISKIMEETDIEDLTKSFKHTYNVLKDIDDNDKYFIHHGSRYTWIRASDLL